MSIAMVRYLIAFAVIAGVFALVGVGLFVPLVGAELQIVDMLIGALITAFSMIVAYFFRRD